MRKIWRSWTPWTGLLLSSLGLAEAAETGLHAIEVTPETAPSDPDPVLKTLQAWSGIAEASWDAEAGIFKAAVEDSARIDPRAVRDGLGLPVQSVLLEFATARGEIDRGNGYLVCPENGVRYWILSTPKTWYLWDFLGRNPWGPNVPLRMRVEMHWGRKRPEGLAPDSVSVVTFEVNREKAGEKPPRKKPK